jgi:type III secretion system needle length determinant
MNIQSTNLASPQFELPRNGGHTDKKAQAEFKAALLRKPGASTDSRTSEGTERILLDALTQARNIASSVRNKHRQETESDISQTSETDHAEAPSHLLEAPEENNTKTESPLTSTQPDQKQQDTALRSAMADKERCLPTVNNRLTKPLSTGHNIKSRHSQDGLRTSEGFFESTPAIFKHSSFSSTGEEHREHTDQEPVGLITEESTVTPLMPPQTPGDRMLASAQSATPQPSITRDLNHLLEALRAHLQAGTSHNANATLLHVTLPSLGAIEVLLTHTLGHLEVEILANSGSLSQLDLAKGDLMNRLQKLAPQQNINLSFTDSQDRDGESRQRRDVHEEWEPEE